jgi:hypothetical protein
MPAEDRKLHDASPVGCGSAVPYPVMRSHVVSNRPARVHRRAARAFYLLRYAHILKVRKRQAFNGGESFVGGAHVLLESMPARHESFMGHEMV